MIGLDILKAVKIYRILVLPYIFTLKKAESEYNFARFGALSILLPYFAKKNNLYASVSFIML